mgnify:CR=1 FL=1
MLLIFNPSLLIKHAAAKKEESSSDEDSSDDSSDDNSSDDEVCKVKIFWLFWEGPMRGSEVVGINISRKY